MMNSPYGQSGSIVGPHMGRQNQMQSLLDQMGPGQVQIECQQRGLFRTLTGSMVLVLVLLGPESSAGQVAPVCSLYLMCLKQSLRKRTEDQNCLSQQPEVAPV